MTTQTETQNTVTVTANDDGTVNISRTGAATQSIAISLLGNQSELADLIAAGGTYTLTSNKGAYDINTFNVTISYKNSASATTNEYMKIGDTVTFPVGAYLISSNLYVGNGKTVDAYDNFALQLESGSSAASFAPYSNICPISGRTESSVIANGKNRFDEDYSETADIVYRSIYVGDGTFTMSTDAPLNTGGGSNLFFFAGQVTSGASTNNNGVYQSTSRTVTAVDGYVTVAYRDANNVNPANYHTQIEVGTVATAYVPYSGRNTATISFGTTVYGGQVDFKTGNVTVEWGYIASYNGETLPGAWISDRDVYAAGTTPTTDAEVCYELATPTTLSLTPDILTMLKNNNSVSGDGVITITALTGDSWS